MSSWDNDYGMPDADWTVWTVPDDWQNPEWDKKTKVHDWKNYATYNLQALWGSFDRKAQCTFAQCLQVIANNEDWD